MTGKKLRLDEILIREGLISEEQIQEALMRQKAHGGKLGSQLLYHRYIDEAGLVKALTMQFGCEGVVLSNIEIPETIINSIPSKIAVARKIVPFDYDPEKNIFKIACEDPTNQDLINEMGFILPNKQVKLYIAAEIVLNTLIAKYYLNRDISLDDNLLLEIPDEATDTGKVEVEDEPLDSEITVGDCRGLVLLVTDEEYSGPLLKSILERDNYSVTVTDSADDAIDIIGDKKFHTVFIKDTVAGDYIDLIDRLRKISPRTKVRYYESSSSLLLIDESSSNIDELLPQNLELLTSLLSSKENLSSSHGSQVGHYVHKLCAEMGLPPKERMLITNAAYLHDLAQFYYQITPDQDYREVIKMTAKLLKSINYPPVLVEMLSSAYIDLKKKYTKRLPIEVLGGNIISIVDLYCENVPDNQKLSLDKFDAIKRKFRDLTGRLFLSEIVESFINMMQKEILSTASNERVSQILIYTSNPGTLYPFELRLKNEGFNPLCENNSDSFINLYKRCQPDIMLLMLHQDATEVIEFIDYLIEQGINLRQVPTLLLTESNNTSKLTDLFEKGIEDIITVESNYDLLIVKLHKIRKQLEEKVKKQDEINTNESGALGRLADINLIDLLQALGPSRRTVKILIFANNENNGQLELYLDKGNIRYARLNDLTGPEAVYEAIAWTDGRWTIESVSEENLPEPNSNQSNESILMEGCRQLDEKTRSGQLL